MANPEVKTISKQKYLPYTNPLNTKWIHDDGVADVLDYFPVSNSKSSLIRDESLLSGCCSCRHPKKINSQPPKRHSGVIRKIGCARGTIELVVDLFPAFNYARDQHRLVTCPKSASNSPGTQKVIFKTETEELHVDIHADRADGERYGFLVMEFELQDKPGLKGQGLYAKLKISVKQSVTFVVYSDETEIAQGSVSSYIGRLEQETFDF